MSEDDLERLRGLLAAAVRSQPLPLSALERRLGLGRGRLGKMLNGRAEIKLAHLLRLLDAIGLPAGTFFRRAFPVEVRTPEIGRTGEAQLQARLHELIGLPPPRQAGSDPLAAGSSTPHSPLSPHTLLTPLSDAELDERLDAAFARFWGEEGKAPAKPAGGAPPAGKIGGSPEDEEDD